MRTLWILTELYYPEQTSTGYLLTKTAEGLAKQFKVKVITGPSTNFYIREPAPSRETRNGVEIFRCWGTSLNKDVFYGRIINILTRTCSILARGLLQCRGKDIVLVVTHPPTLPFAALLIKWVKRTPFVLLIHDVYPEVLVASGFCSPRSAAVELARIATQFLYKSALAIVSIGRDMTELALTKLPPKDRRINLIPNWAENEIVQPAPRQRNRILNELQLSDRFVILYAGNIGRTHGIEYLVEAAASLINDASIHFLVVGLGAKKHWLEQSITARELGNISLMRPVPRSELTVVLNAANVALISFVPGMAGVSVPSRMYNQMAAGKAIIAMADENSELAQVVREENIGWVLAPGDVQGLIKAIQEAIANPDKVIEMGIRAHQAATTKYTFKKSDAAYRALFKDLFIGHAAK